MEQAAQEKLLSLLPGDLRPDYESLLGHTQQDKELIPLVKAADKLSALIKCVEERRMGNTEFARQKPPYGHPSRIWRYRRSTAF